MRFRQTLHSKLDRGQYNGVIPDGLFRPWRAERTSTESMSVPRTTKTVC